MPKKKNIELVTTDGPDNTPDATGPGSPQGGYVSDEGVEEIQEVSQEITEEQVEQMYEFDVPEEFQDAAEGEQENTEEEKTADEDPSDEGTETAVNDTERVDLDREILARAARLGLDPDEARKIPKESLDKILDRLDPIGTKAEDTQDDEQKAGSETESAIDVSKLQKLDPEEFELADQWNTMVDFIQDTHKQMKEQQDYISTMRQREFDNTFDSAISGLGEDYAPIFGKGTVNELDRNSDAFKNRLSVVEEIQLLQAGYEARGQTPPSFDQLLKRAVNGLFPDVVQGKQEKQTKAKERNKQIIGKPSRKSDRVASSNGRHAAIEAVGARLSDLGIDTSFDIDEEF